MKYLLIALLWIPVCQASAVTCKVPSDVYGATRSELAQKQTGSGVTLSDIPITEHTIGYGPGNQFAFETTFFDGKAWLAQGDETKPHGVAARHVLSKNDKNVFAVTATPSSWLSAIKLDGIDRLALLAAQIDKQVAELGCGEDTVLPFKISGIAQSVTWSIESQPERKIETYQNEPVELVGIYAIARRNDFFAVGKTHFHVHVIFPQRQFAAHVRDVALASGAKLKFGQ